jgi:AAA domain
MSHDQSFPRELLHQPSSARLAYFRALTIGHPLLLRVYDDLRLAIRDSAQGSIIMVQGPAGVGKTTLLQRVEKDLKERLAPDLAQDVERLPVVRIDAIAPESGSFNWKDYFRRLLIALEEPESLIDRKVIPNQSGATFQSGALRLISRENAVSSRLRHAVEQTLRRRRPLAVLVDDAQHLAIMGSGRKLLDQINTIKSIANLSQITHVLTGTYELMTLRHLNGQLSRRSVDIEFNRYLSDNSEHREAFINCLWTFQQHLPLPKTPELVNQWDYFYERSIGCVGVLKDWLTGALALALENGAQTLTSRDLERRALSVTQCARMLSETVDGERKLTESTDAKQELRKNLGLTVEMKSRQLSSNDPGLDATAPQVAAKAKRRRIGQRNPSRDEIGAKRA